jgi:hypothetical protein
LKKIGFKENDTHPGEGALGARLPKEYQKQTVGASRSVVLRVFCPLRGQKCPVFVRFGAFYAIQQ